MNSSELETKYLNDTGIRFVEAEAFMLALDDVFDALGPEARDQITQRTLDYRLTHETVEGPDGPMEMVCAPATDVIMALADLEPQDEGKQEVIGRLWDLACEDMFSFPEDADSGGDAASRDDSEPDLIEGSEDSRDDSTFDWLDV